jgi:hypothetical protein
MADAHVSVVDLSRLDRETLEALVVAQQEKLLSRNSEIEHLKLIIAKLRRMMFGTKSEKIAREVEQLELKLEELETGEDERAPAPPASGTPRRKRKRRPLSEHLPRETHRHMHVGPTFAASSMTSKWPTVLRLQPKRFNASAHFMTSSARSAGKRPF